MVNQTFEEKYVPIPGYEGKYEVSNTGKVRSLTRKVPCRNGVRVVKGRVLKTVKTDGYPKVSLSGKGRTVHRLVAEVFVHRGRKDQTMVNHIDNDRANNVYTNLEWVTNKENIQHGVRQRRNAYGERQGGSILTEEQVKSIPKLRESGLTLKEIGKMFGCDLTTVHYAATGKSWKHLIVN